MATPPPDASAAAAAPPDTPAAAPPPAAAPRTASLSALFRFANGRDKLAGALALACAAGSGVVIPLTTLLLGALLNGSSSGGVGDAARVDAAALYMTLIAIGAFVCLGGGVLLASLSAARQAARLRVAYVRALLRQDAAWGEAAGLGEAAARLAEDSLSVQAGTGEKLFLVVAGAAQFIGSIALAFAVAADAWMLALTLLAALPGAVAAIGGLFTFVSALAGDSDDAYARAGAVLAEALALARTVAALGGEEHEAARYDAHLATAEKAGVRKGVVAGASQGVFLFTMAALYGIGLYAGARFVGLNRAARAECDAFGVSAAGDSFACFSGGTVVQVLFSIVGGAFALGIVVPNLGALAAARAAAARLHAVIDRVPPIDALPAERAVGVPPPLPRAAAALPVAPYEIAFEGVSFSYPLRPAERVLENFSLVIPPGRTVALVGASGSGKSTIVSLLARTYDVTAGRVTLGGVDIRALPVAWLRAQLAVVAQEPQLLPLSVRDNIAAGGGASDADVAAAAAVADAAPFIDALPARYATVVTAAQLSGGQKQRICIARALARRAPILCFDEATSALDSRSEARILAGIAAAAAAAPRAAAATRIVVAHRLSTVKDADMIVVMERGRVVETGAHAALVGAGGPYARLWAAGSAGSAEEPPAAAAAADAAAAAPAAASAASSADVTVAVAADDGGAAPHAKGAAPPAARLWRDAWRLQRPEAGTLAIAIGLAAINGVALPAFSIIVSNFIAVFYTADVDAMVASATMYLGVFFGLAIAMFALNTLQGVAFAAAGEPFVRRLRRAAFSSIIAQPAAFFEAPGNAPGRLAAGLGIDAAKLKLALGPRLGEKVGSLATLVAGVIVCLVASWELTLVIAAMMPFVVVAADAENRVSFGTEGSSEREGLASAVGIAAEACASVRVVHAFALEDAVLGRFKEAQRGSRRVTLRRALALGVGFGSSQAAQALATAIIFKVGLALMTAGRATAQGVVLCFFAFQFASFGLPNLVSLAGDVAAIRASVASIFALIHRVPEIDGSAAAAAAWAVGGAPGPQPGQLRLDGVHFSYPTREAPVLRGVSLVVEPGETAALVGPSGCGKSSVVALLLRLYDATGGAVLVDGLDVRARPARVLRDRIGWVGQEAPLFNDTIEYNVAYGRAGGAAAKPTPDEAAAAAGADAPAAAAVVGGDAPAAAIASADEPAAPAARADEPAAAAAIADASPPTASGSAAAKRAPPPEDVARAAADAHATAFISNFAAGFATPVGEGGRALSGGQRQRVVLARALVRKPAFLLLDEATAALDNASERAVQASIDALLAAQRGAGATMTTLIVAHRLQTIRRADKIFVMDAGLIVESGTFDELLKRGGLFAKLAAAQGVE